MILNMHVSLMYAIECPFYSNSSLQESVKCKTKRIMAFSILVNQSCFAKILLFYLCRMHFRHDSHTQNGNSVHKWDNTNWNCCAQLYLLLISVQMDTAMLQGIFLPVFYSQHALFTMYRKWFMMSGCLMHEKGEVFCLFYCVRNWPRTVVTKTWNSLILNCPHIPEGFLEECWLVNRIFFKKNDYD